MSERTFTVQRVIPRSPWDVYEFLADEGQQTQWRERHTGGWGTVAEASPYTQVVYSDRLIFDIEPEGQETLVRMTKTHSGSGALGGFALRMRSRRTHEDDLMSILMRIESALVYNDM